MRNKILLIVCLFAVSLVLFAQNVGDQATAGYTFSRTYLNSDMGDFVPPLTRIRSVSLGGISNAGSLLVFENSGSKRLLVGESVLGTVSFGLFDAETGAQQWSQTFAGVGGTLNYIPSYSNDIVLLGGPATTTVQAVRVSTGATLWSDTSVGSTSGRYPALTNGLALYHGMSGLRAADPALGPSSSFWQLDVTTAEAPVSVWGQRAYVLDGSGTLRSLDVASGAEAWNTAGADSVNPNIIATEQYVFINSSVNGFVGALSAVDGSGVWAEPTGLLSQTPATALAYDQLFVFTAANTEGDAQISAHSPDTGDLLWSATEQGSGVEFGLVANNVVYYYHSASQRIRARDAFTGNLVGSWAQEDVRGLSAADGLLYVLLADQVDVYQAANTIFFAHLADGGGQQTVLTLTNRSSEAAMGTVSFISTDGNPLVVNVDGVGVTSNVPFDIPAGGSVAIQTLGGSQARSGWARVTADQRLTGSSLFQFVDPSGVILTEAGVANSPPTGRARTFVEVSFPPETPATISTGVAVANISGSETASIRLTLLDEAGAVEAMSTRLLASMNQEARFIQELFPGETTAGFRGTLVIESDIPVVVTALRTQQGLQLSSFAVGN